jgi:DNA-binding response OmpR family regulator
MLQLAGDLELDTEHHLLYLKGRQDGPIRLTPMESRLLAALMETPDQVVARAHLMKKVWGTEYLGDTRTLDVHICWLRRKIEADPARPTRIVTHRRRGYELRAGGG